MNKKLIAIIVSLSIIILGFTGCTPKEEEKKSETPAKTFDEALCKNTWESQILGIGVKISFKEDGTGHVDAAGVSEDFDYSLSNVTEDPIGGDITISGTGLSEVDGKTIHADYSGENITVTYNGTDYTFTPVEESA